MVCPRLTYLSTDPRIVVIFYIFFCKVATRRGCPGVTAVTGTPSKLSRQQYHHIGNVISQNVRKLMSNNTNSAQRGIQNSYMYVLKEIIYELKIK